MNNKCRLCSDPKAEFNAKGDIILRKSSQMKCKFERCKAAMLICSPPKIDSIHLR